MKKIAIILFAFLTVVISFPVMATKYIVCSECGEALWQNEPYLFYQTYKGEKIYLCSSCINQNIYYTSPFIPTQTESVSCDVCGSSLDPNYRNYTEITFEEIELRNHYSYLYDDQNFDLCDTDGLMLDIDLTICDDCLFGFHSGGGYVNIDTPNSTAFSNISYNKYSQILTVTFRDSNAKYEYKDFPYIEWLNFCDADSLGSHYNKYIKGKYECEKIN